MMLVNYPDYRFPFVPDTTRNVHFAVDRGHIVPLMIDIVPLFLARHIRAGNHGNEGQDLFASTEIRCASSFTIITGRYVFRDIRDRIKRMASVSLSSTYVQFSTSLLYKSLNREDI